MVQQWMAAAREEIFIRVTTGESPEIEYEEAIKGMQAHCLYTPDFNEFQYFDFETGNFRIDFDKFARFNSGRLLLMVCGVDADAQVTIRMNVFTVPVLSPEAFIRYQNTLGLKVPQQERAHAGVLPQHLGDRLGWEEMVAMLGEAYNKLDPADRARCAVLVSNYGEAGAVNLFGPRYGLPHAISGYMNNYLWGPRGATGEVVLAYWDDRSTLVDLFEEVAEVARFQHPFVMDRQNNRPLYLCRRIRAPMNEAWPKFKTFK